MIKNAKFSGYYFDMNLNIWGDFQICISVPLKNTVNILNELFFFAIFELCFLNFCVLCIVIPNNLHCTKIEVFH